MNVNIFLDRIPLFGVFLGTLVIVLGAISDGFWTGARPSRRPGAGGE